MILTRGHHTSFWHKSQHCSSLRPHPLSNIQATKRRTFQLSQLPTFRHHGVRLEQVVTPEERRTGTVFLSTVSRTRRTGYDRQSFSLPNRNVTKTQHRMSYETFFVSAVSRRPSSPPLDPPVLLVAFSDAGSSTAIGKFRLSFSPPRGRRVSCTGGGGLAVVESIQDGNAALPRLARIICPFPQASSHAAVSLLSRVALLWVGWRRRRMRMCNCTLYDTYLTSFVSFGSNARFTVYSASSFSTPPPLPHPAAALEEGGGGVILGFSISL